MDFVEFKRLLWKQFAVDTHIDYSVTDRTKALLYFKAYSDWLEREWAFHAGDRKSVV